MTRPGCAFVDIPLNRVLSRENSAVDEDRGSPRADARARPDLKSRTGDTRRFRMAVLVRIPTPLRAMTKGSAEVQVTADTVADLIADLERQYPGMRDRLVEESGEIRRFINIYVNQEDIRFLQGEKTALKQGD